MGARCVAELQASMRIGPRPSGRDGRIRRNLGHFADRASGDAALQNGWLISR
jgi:hypothetical protein